MARAYHAPESLIEHTGVMTKEEEDAYYAQFLADMDRNINIKNGVAVPIP